MSTEISANFNKLATLSRLENHYYIIRHGESLANKAGIVSSTYRISVANHGLTDIGITQATGAGKSLLETITTQQASGDQSISLDDIIFYSSDFARAYETAVYVRSSIIGLLPSRSSPASPIALHLPRLLTHPSLRERSFGDFEGKSHESYAKVWEQDIAQSPHSSHYGVESIASVVSRTTGFIVELESTWQGKHIVLVSHGDICQILQSAFLLNDPRTHRSLPHMKNAEVRVLALGSSSPDSGATSNHGASNPSNPQGDEASTNDSLSGRVGVEAESPSSVSSDDINVT